MPNILVTRLVLNLRTFGNETSSHGAHHGAAGDPSRLRPIEFSPQTQVESRILGNIGAPIDYDQWNGSQFECAMPETDGLAGPSTAIGSQAIDLEHGLRDGQD